MLHARRRRLAVLAAIVVASSGAALVTSTVAAAAPPRTEPASLTTESAYLTRLTAALDLCQDRYPRTNDAALLSRCVGDLAPPQEHSAFEIDLFRTFTSCLSEAAGPDSMYPGVDDAEVNACLEKWDVY